MALVFFASLVILALLVLVRIISGKSSRAIPLLALIAIVTGIQLANEGGHVNGGSPATSQKPASEDKTTPVWRAACIQDADCLSREYNSKAWRACRPRIEKYAKIDVEWQVGFTVPPFDRYGTVPGKPDTVRFLGDAVKFQNGFGAWITHSYICWFNIATGEVEKVEVFQGRL